MRFADITDFCLQGLLDVFFPLTCHRCGERIDSKENGICCSCDKAIPFIQPPLCTRCGIPMLTGESHLCGDCLKNPPLYSLARSLVVYEDFPRRLIHQLKYADNTTVLIPIKKIARCFDYSPFIACDLVIPVPLHHERLKKRGINQSLLLAKIFFKESRLAINPLILIKNKKTCPQVQLGVSLRKKNVEGAYLVKNPYLIKNKRICLVDDVYTTGSTVDECSRILLRSGAREVRVITFARVLLK